MWHRNRHQEVGIKPHQTTVSKTLDTLNLHSSLQYYSSAEVSTCDNIRPIRHATIALWLFFFNICNSSSEVGHNSIPVLLSVIGEPLKPLSYHEKSVHRQWSAHIEVYLSFCLLLLWVLMNTCVSISHAVFFTVALRLSYLIHIDQIANNWRPRSVK